MTIRGRLALAMMPLVLATVAAVGLLANYFGAAGPRTLMAAGVVALLLALIVAHLMARMVSRLLAAETARQAAMDRALAESEQNAQAIIKTSLDAFFQTDLAGVILEWGPQAESLTGWTRKEALGANVVNLLVPERLREAHRQRRKKMLNEELGTSS